MFNVTQIVRISCFKLSSLFKNPSVILFEVSNINYPAHQRVPVRKFRREPPEPVHLPSWLV